MNKIESRKEHKYFNRLKRNRKERRTYRTENTKRRTRKVILDQKIKQKRRIKVTYCFLNSIIKKNRKKGETKI